MQILLLLAKSTILTAVTRLWSYSVARILRLVTYTEKVKVSCMLSCISYFNFNPLELRTAESASEDSV